MKERQLDGWRILVGLAQELPWSVRLPDQTHGSKIVTAAALSQSSVSADGVVLNHSDSPSGIHTADCLPLVITSPTQALVLHVSRKTLIAGLLDAVARTLPPSEISSVFIGPHICPRHFTFNYLGPELSELKKKFPTAVVTKGEQTHVSLITCVQHYFTAWGVPAGHITRDTRCTFEDPALPSYRRWLGTGKVGSRKDFITAVASVSNH